MIAKIQAAGRSDIGRKRNSNQDQFLIADLNKSMQVQSSSLNLEPRSRLYGIPQGRLLVVADGMGGHQAGNRASALAIHYLVNKFLNNSHWFYQLDEGQEREFTDVMKNLFRSAHEAIEREAGSNAEFKGMGTTLSMCYVSWPFLYLVHVGDSRCYLLHRGVFKQLTRDHTMANQMAEQGTLPRHGIESSPWSNVLWNALGGGGREVVPDVGKIMLEPGDILLMCSDGLNKHVNDEEIQNILELEADPNSACRALIELANFRGGLDNTTVVVARVEEPETRPARTMVAAQITWERMISDLAGYKVMDTAPGPVDYIELETDPATLAPSQVSTQEFEKK